MDRYRPPPPDPTSPPPPTQDKGLGTGPDHCQDNLTAAQAKGCRGGGGQQLASGQPHTA